MQGLKNIFLSFPSYRPPNNPLHSHIAALSPGDPLKLQSRQGRWELRDISGNLVGLMAKSFRPPERLNCISAHVSAICVWGKNRSKNGPNGGDHHKDLRSESWEVVIPSLVFGPEHPPSTENSNGRRTDIPTNTSPDPNPR